MNKHTSDKRTKDKGQGDGLGDAHKEQGDAHKGQGDGLGDAHKGQGDGLGDAHKGQGDGLGDAHKGVDKEDLGFLDFPNWYVKILLKDNLKKAQRNA